MEDLRVHSIGAATKVGPPLVIEIAPEPEPEVEEIRQATESTPVVLDITAEDKLARGKRKFIPPKPKEKHDVTSLIELAKECNNAKSSMQTGKRQSH